MRKVTMACTAMLCGVALAAASDSAAPGRMGGSGFRLTGTSVVSLNTGVMEGEGLRLVGQITRRAPGADVSEPFGVLDAQDKTRYMALLGSGDQRADLAAPWGIVDSADLSEFVRRYEQGQP